MVLTIVIVRIILFATWSMPAMEGQITDQWHHMYTGIILVLISLPFSTKLIKFIRAIGIGLFIDEWMHVFHIIFQVKHMDYWSWDFLLMTLIGILLVGKYYYKIRL